jgi:hypothetical protein
MMTDQLKDLYPKDTEKSLLFNFIKNNKVSKESLSLQFQLNKGVYALWMMKDMEFELNLSVEFKGTRNSDPPYEKSKFLTNSNVEDYQCLYVGKSSNFAQRISMHLMMDTPEYYAKPETSNDYIKRWEKNKNQILKRNSQCQFRAGFEHIIRNSGLKDTRELMIKSIGLTFIPITAFEERFYFEDLAIGYYKPWFNLDSER